LVHVSTIDPAILERSEELKKLDEGEIVQMKNEWVRIPIKAGEKIGTATQWQMLGIVAVDTRYNNTGYANPKSYESQAWRLHGVAAFDYFEEPVKTLVENLGWATSYFRRTAAVLTGGGVSCRPRPFGLSGWVITKEIS